MLIAFVVTPIVEIAVLIQVGGWLGLWPTLALIILTALAGTWMLRQQGFAVLSRAQSQLEQGSLPLAEVFEGFCLVVAGALLLTPGFVTDVIGGALLLPPVRTWLYRVLGGHFRASVSMHGVAGKPGQTPGSGHDRRTGGRGPVMEGEFETMTPEDIGTEEAPDQGKRSTGGGDEGSDGAAGRSAPDKPMPPPRGSWDDKP